MGDIYISGEITQEAARYFSSELTWYETPVVVHLNSKGGDPFAAIAIAHTIRHSDKDITVSVEGLCASAAVLILCCGRKVVSAWNSLFMTHAISVMLEDCYDLGELSQIQTKLEKVTETVQKTLATRMKNVDLSQEIWYDADGALAAGLIDEIDSAQVVEIKTDAKSQMMFVNGSFFKMKTLPPISIDG